MGDRRSVAGWLHLAMTMLLAGGLLILVGLLAAGRVEIRAVTPAGATPAPGGAVTPAVGARVEPVPGGDHFFGLLGHTAYCLKYEGTWIDFWIEVDVEGQKTRLGEDLGVQLRAADRVGADGQPPDGEPSGYVVWVRRSEGGKEVWDLAVSVVGQDGKARAAVRRIGISPPPPRASRGAGEGPASGGSLGGGQEVTLAEFMTFGDAGQITRKAALKCKAAK